MMTKTQKVLILSGRNLTGTHVDFTQREEDPPHPLLTAVFIKNDDWQEMGRPETITVTIEPGDLLNPSTVAEAIFGGKKTV